MTNQFCFLSEILRRGAAAHNLSSDWTAASVYVRLPEKRIDQTAVAHYIPLRFSIISVCQLNHSMWRDNLTDSVEIQNS